jgi:hypothetical protein
MILEFCCEVLCGRRIVSITYNGLLIGNNTRLELDIVRALVEPVGEVNEVLLVLCDVVLLIVD